MEIRIEVIPWLSRAFGHRGAGRLAFSRMLTPGTTLAGLLGDLVREYPEFADYALTGDGSLAFPHVCVTVNGEVVPIPTELGRTLSDGDVLTLLPAFAGGDNR